MSKKTKNILLLILIFYFFCFLFLVSPAKAVSAFNPTMPHLQIPIPDLKIPNKFLEFTKPKCTGEKDNQVCEIWWISQYISAIYKYAIGIIGILATVVMMIGGLIWLTAGGNATRIGEAKAWIGASVAGLVIALCSYMILYQINPEIVKLKPIKVKVVKEIEKKETAPPGTLTESEARNQLKSQMNWINVLPECPPGKTRGCVVLSGVRQETINETTKLRGELSNYYAFKIGDYKYILRDNAAGTVYITGGTEGCAPGEKAVHSTGVYSHCNGYKIDLNPNTKLDEYIVKNYPRIEDRIEQNGTRTAQYKSPSGAIYAAEYKDGKFNHWDILVK